MSEIVTEKQADMTRQEAQHALSQLRGTEERQKEILLEMHSRSAHKAMGYTNWEEFAEGVFGLSYARFKQLIRAAKTEQILDRKLSISSTSSSTSLISKFNEEMLLELARLKDPDLIACAAKEALDAASTMAYRGKESRFNGQLRTPLVKGIVNRLLSTPQSPLEVVDKPTVNHQELERRGLPEKAAELPYIAPPLIPTPDFSKAESRFDKAVETSDAPPLVVTPALALAPTLPAEKYTRGMEHPYIACRWDEDEEILRVVFLLPDGSEGAVCVPGGYLP